MSSSNTFKKPTLVILAAGRARRYGGCKPLAPIGINGEAIIDLLASDALSAGFEKIVVVVGTSTGPAIRYHIQQCWPKSVDVHFALQQNPRGTVDAVLAASEYLGDAPFGVCNADDLYGKSPMAQLAQHLSQPYSASGPKSGSGPEPVDKVKTNALVGFLLRNAVLGDAPLTRAICKTNEEGYLIEIQERRNVRSLGDGSFFADDGNEPGVLDGDNYVSVNLWGFLPSMLDEFRIAMEREEYMDGTGGSASSGDPETPEVLLPDIVSEHLELWKTKQNGLLTQLGSTNTSLNAGPCGFILLPTSGRCLGVTHANDLLAVQGEIAHVVGAGVRPATLWGDYGL